MPDKISCPRCKKSGFVRVERVIKGTRTFRSYYCGSCNYQWEITENGTSQPPEEGEKPDRSRDR